MNYQINKIVGIGEIMDYARNVHAMMLQLKISLRRLRYLKHHLSRCKKDEDSVKLIVMYAVEVVYAKSLIKQATKQAHEMFDSMGVPRIKKQEVLILPEGIY